ncbi:MAG: hypothetical protein IKD10_01500 [Lentisphaeria bacterium]|nr:hypothetical protein [Lentisphaeria bacterium]
MGWRAKPADGRLPLLTGSNTHGTASRHAPYSPRMRRTQAASIPILSHIFPYSPILSHKKAATHTIARVCGEHGIRYTVVRRTPVCRRDGLGKYEIAA